MPTPLPELIEPMHLAERGVRLKGEIELSRMTRLAPLLKEQEGAVWVDILFSKNNEGVQCINGELKGGLTVLCQRCLEPMQIPIRAELRLELIDTLAAEPRITDNYEPLLVTAGSVSLIELVEDELLLALPISPMHPLSECAVTHYTAAPIRENPFAVLSHLKKRQ